MKMSHWECRSTNWIRSIANKSMIFRGYFAIRSSIEAMYDIWKQTIIFYHFCWSHMTKNFNFPLGGSTRYQRGCFYCWLWDNPMWLLLSVCLVEKQKAGKPFNRRPKPKGGQGRAGWGSPMQWGQHHPYPHRTDRHDWKHCSTSYVHGK